MSPRPYAERLLEHHRLDLPVLVAYHDVELRKPHPHPIVTAASLLGISPWNCIYVGDQPEDIQAAVAAGANPIGISWDGTLETTSWAEKARGIFGDWDHVMSSIEKILGSS